jgi:endonuclease/exonuclease/phosphatase family metal-dependent hydrolase
VIVNGDFNSKPDSTAYGILTTDSSRGFVFKNAFDLAAEWHVVSTQTPTPSYDPSIRIDHNFLAGDGVDWKVSSWIVDMSTYGPNQRYPSDHFPIVSVVEH